MVSMAAVDPSNTLGLDRGFCRARIYLLDCILSSSVVVFAGWRTALSDLSCATASTREQTPLVVIGRALFVR